MGKEETYLQVLYIYFVIIQSHCEYDLQPSAEGERLCDYKINVHTLVKI